MTFYKFTIAFIATLFVYFVQIMATTVVFYFGWNKCINPAFALSKSITFYQMCEISCFYIFVVKLNEFFRPQTTA